MKSFQLFKTIVWEHQRKFLNMCLIFLKLGNTKGTKRNSRSLLPRNLCPQNLRYELWYVHI